MSENEQVPPYEVALYDPWAGLRVVPDAPQRWCVIGPGIPGWQGVIPPTKIGMSHADAAALAAMLNTAFHMGQIARSRALLKMLNTW